MTMLVIIARLSEDCFVNFRETVTIVEPITLDITVLGFAGFKFGNELADFHLLHHVMIMQFSY